MKVFEYTIMGVVTLAVVFAFFVVGSPKEERLHRFDLQRTNDLQSVQWQVINYWQGKGELPPTLLVLNDDISGFRVPVDPETGQQYIYETRDKLKFALCADFARPTVGGGDSERSILRAPEASPILGKGGVPESWTHGEGHICFERTIDPDFYQPNTSGSVPIKD